MTVFETDQFVVIEHGATGVPGVHGPYDSREEAEAAVKDWSWSRWTTHVEVGSLASRRHQAYANSRPGWTSDAVH